MRTKLVIAILFLLIIPFGCCSQQKLSEPKMVLGLWHLCKIYNGKIATNFNVCPDISFDSESRGYLKTNSTSAFEWTISENIIILKFDKSLDDKDIMLGLSNCSVKYSYDNLSEYLELENIKSGNRYILSRSKRK